MAEPLLVATAGPNNPNPAADAVMTEAGAAPAPPTLGSVTIVQAPQTIHDQHLPNEAIAVDLTPKELPILDQRSAKLVDEFQSLLEKSQQLFAGLRDLPPTGGQKQWQPYFQRTFEVYTKLWKFQQQHRIILENKDYYGLKRWEIGEIASKISQLYYHFYLRTSETNYLQESLVFYEAIRDRQYFKDVMDSRNPALVIKKLRYYARYIVVCLLLNRYPLIKPAMDELTQHVEDYTRMFKPSDAAEWNLVISEISHFLEADRKIMPVNESGVALSVPQRLQIDRTPKTEKDGTPKLRLQEAILVGNNQNQVKFSELTLDMYRMLQSLEREPLMGKNSSGSLAALAQAPPAAAGEPKQPTSFNVTGTGGDKDGDRHEDPKALRRSNPHKYLLYRPNFNQLQLYLTTAFKDVNDNAAILLYMSADGAKRTSSAGGDVADRLYTSGISTASSSRKGADKPELFEQQALYPGDLIAFSRKPLFVVLDSNNATCFNDFPKIFQQPLVVLMSPSEYPPTVKDATQTGNLFTLFLHSPIKAFVSLCTVETIPTRDWETCVAHFTAIESLITEMLNKEDSPIDKAYRRFAQDDFLRQFIVRFVLMSALLPLHSAFDAAKYLPTAFPPLPQDLAVAPELVDKIKELITLTGVTCFKTE